jgi:hypothetical protein
MSIDYERVGKRLADARRRRTAAEVVIAKAKAAVTQADGEIEECLAELESGEPVRPLLDIVDRAAEAPRPGSRGAADFFGKRQRSPAKSKVDRVELSHKRDDGSVRTVVIGGEKAERPDRKLRPRGADAEAIERIAREAQDRG